MEDASGRTSGEPPPLARDVARYYERGLERDRLDVDYGPLERERTRETLDRYLPTPPAVVADVGGGAGVHALWLAGRGYEVHLRDPVPLHVEQALEAARSLEAPLASAVVGDARTLDLDQGSVDVALLLGPLYHLQEAADRRRALEEARRVLRDGGLLVVAAISRWAPIVDGLRLGLLENPDHLRAADEAAATGRFDPPPESGFTESYLHRPEELRGEVTTAGFTVEDLVGLEGIGFALGDFGQRWADPSGREALLGAARRTERVPELLGVSPHLLLVARRGSLNVDR